MATRGAFWGFGYEGHYPAGVGSLIARYLPTSPETPCGATACASADRVSIKEALI